MLTKKYAIPIRALPGTRQAGVVLIIALVVLVALTLAAITLVRSVDTANIIAGNLAFQQSAARSADAGLEAVIAWLEDCHKTHVTCSSSTLEKDSPTNGYSASGSNPNQNPAPGQSWDAFWTQTLQSRAFTLPKDGAGNTVSYVVDRMCNNPGSQTGGAACMSSPVATTATGNAEEGGEVQLNAPSVVYYRITVRVDGPRNTVSYVQAMISM